MPPVPLVAARRDHLVVCGEDALACRVIEELTTRYGQSVTVLLRSQSQGHGQRIAALPRVRVIEREELSADAFSAARIDSAQALALLGQDDLGNFHGALRAQELNPRLRLVVRIFNTSLGERMHTFFTRQRRRPVRALLRAARALFWHKLGIAFLGLFALLAAGFILLFTLGGKTLGDSFYLTFMNAAGAALTETGDRVPVKVAQVLQTFAGLAFIPVATAAVVSVRLTGSLRDHDRPMSGHVIVAGLGNVGTRIVGQLHDLGVGVVCVDKSEQAAGIPLARRLGLRVVIGETHREETLRAAGIDTCQALVSVTNSDTVNLETAPQDRIYVLATRAGLSRVLARSQPVPA